MEKINNKYINFKNALNQLDEILTEIRSIDCDGKIYKIYRDSVIKRFEFCYDLFWKLLKLYLEKNFEEEYLFS